MATVAPPTTAERPIAAWRSWQWRRRAWDAGSVVLLWGGLATFCVWGALAHTDEFVVGVVVGCVLALGSIGLTLIYGILKFGHFAHGDMMQLSSYVAFLLLTGVLLGETRDTEVPLSINDLPGATNTIWRFSFGYGLLIAMAIACVAMAALLVGIDQVVYKPLRNRKAGIVILAIASLGLAIATRSAILMFWGPNPRYYASGIRETIELPWGTRIPADQIFIVAATFVLVALVYLLLYFTKLGRAMRATADNADLARVAGIDTDQVLRWTWVVAGVLIGIAGVLLALQSQLKPELGFTLILPLFAATILGGVGSPPGALVGGLIVGITQEVAVTFDVLGPGYKFAVAFAILILVLLVRPRGLFGSTT